MIVIYKHKIPATRHLQTIRCQCNKANVNLGKFSFGQGDSGEAWDTPDFILYIGACSQCGTIYVADVQ